MTATTDGWDELLRRVASSSADRPFMEHPGGSLTFGAFDQRVERLASAFVEHGLVPGDRVAIVLRNLPEYLETMFAAVRAGLVVVPVNRRLSAAEIGHILDHSGARAVVTEQRFEFVLGLGGDNLVRFLVGDRLPDDTPNAVRYEEALARAVVGRQLPGSSGRVQAIYYTSGTTGQPKGVVRSHAANLAMLRGALDRVPTGADDVWLYAIPFHSAGVYALALPALAAGARLVVLPEFDPAETLRLVDEHQVTHLLLVPTMWEMVLREPAHRDASLASVRYALWGGMPMLQATAQRLADWLPVPPLGCYGATEATCITYSTPEIAASGRLDSSGTAIAGMEIGVYDEQGSPLPPGAYGEVWARGDVLMDEYFRDPERTAEAMVDGWFRSGDWGRIDSDGALTVADRQKDMIISGGENVYPAEVEQVIAQHPGIAEIAVAGVEHPLWGQSVCAFVVRADPGITADDIAALCTDRLARYKHPREIVFMEDLPKNAMGKILKKELVATYRQGRADADGSSHE